MHGMCLQEFQTGMDQWNKDAAVLQAGRWVIRGRSGAKEENFAAQISFYQMGPKKHRRKWSYGAPLSSWVEVSNICLCSPLPGKMIQFDQYFFQMG